MYKLYTGETPLQLDTDMCSTVTAKMSTALWCQKQAQYCDISGSDSAEIAMYTFV